MREQHLNLKLRAPYRLAHLKQIASLGKWVRPMTWRDVRFANFKSHTGLDHGLNDKQPIWYSHDEEPTLRRTKWADEVEGADINHRGWFTKHDGTTYKDGSGLARGFVVALPHGRFLAGYWWGDNDERVYYPTLYTDATDAAAAADHYAQRFAEAQQEDSAKWEAARDLERDIEQATIRLVECLALRHKFPDGGYRNEAHRCIETIREKRETLSTEYADYQ